MSLKQQGINGLWHTVRSKAHVIFPVLGALMVALILASPLLSGPLAFLSSNAFARFCMFWCLALFAVLSFANRAVRPSTVATISTAIAVVVGGVFYLVCSACAGAPDLSSFLLSCLSGAILGALAGTWLIYVLEVYVGR